MCVSAALSLSLCAMLCNSEQDRVGAIIFNGEMRPYVDLSVVLCVELSCIHGHSRFHM